MKNSISVVIPNYNGKSLLEKNLPSILQSLNFAKIEHELIVSDDCSTDDSVSFLKKNYPDIHVIAGTKNLGFAGNINRGLQAASKDLIFALNSDIWLEEDYFVYKLDYFKEEDCFAVMGAIHDPATKKVVPLNLDTQQNFFGFISAKKTENYNFDRPVPTFFASGSNMLICAKKLKQLNYFNEVFSPFYGEDADLGLRAWRMGWSSYYEPKSICYHQTSSTIKKYNSQKKVRAISRRNKLIFHEIHLANMEYLKFFIKMGIDLTTRFLIFDFGYYKAFLAYFKAKPTLSEQKKLFPLKYSTQEAIRLYHKKKNSVLNTTNV
jgi:GT2 family glycosyltransferase